VCTLQSGQTFLRFGFLKFEIISHERKFYFD
jgi:hypothetical protein